MRLLAIALFLIAAAKIGVQQHMFRSGSSEAVIAAYRERAVTACQKDPHGPRLVASPLVWNAPAEVRLVIGKTGIDVWPWQIDHALWRARWRDPYLHLVAGGSSDTILCEYDIVRGHAVVQRS
jgi:hypothetical protein